MEENKLLKVLSNTQKWVFTIVINVLLLIIGYKVCFANYSFDLSKFSFSEFLSLFLALFSIAISVAFYFKATDSSSHFYDNTYKFTKDIAELLVKIESSFGEKLKHLDEAYTNIRDRFDRFPNAAITKEKVQTQVELDEVTKEYEKKLKEKETLLNETLQLAHSNDAERKLIIDKLNDKENELRIEKEKVDKLEHKLISYNNIERDRYRKPYNIDDMLSTILQILITLFGTKFIRTATSDEIKSRYKAVCVSIPLSTRYELQKYGLADQNENLTEDAVRMLKNYVSNI